MPPNPLLHRRRHLAAASILALSGCAKFPNGRTNADFVKVTFTLTVAGHIRSDYLYDVALYLSTDPNPRPQYAPLPVYDASKAPANDRMAGYPTHFVEYSSERRERPVIYVFQPTGNLDAPTDPNRFAESPNPVVIYDPVRPQYGATPDPEASRRIRFSVYVNTLAAGGVDPKTYKSMLVNFITMNRLTRPESSSRQTDALGSPATPEFIRVDLRANPTYSNHEGAGAGLEGPNDFPGIDPDLDIVDWQIEVQQP